MGRIIFKNNNLSLNTEQKLGSANKFINDVDVFKKRSKKYLDLIAGLDSKEIANTKGMKALLEAIQEEFGTADIESLPLGIVSKCFLGHPYEVHLLDLSGSQIINHYKTNEPMHVDFEKGRTIAKHNAYAMVEIYRDKMVLIHEDGTVTKL